MIWFQFGCAQPICLQVQSLWCFHIDVTESTKAALLLVRSDTLTINRWETRYGIDVGKQIVVYYIVCTHSGLTKMSCNRKRVLPISLEVCGVHSIGWLQGRAQWDEGRPDDIPTAFRSPKYGRFLPEAARLIQGVIHSTHEARLHPAAHLEHKTGQTPSGQARKIACLCVK